MALEGTLTTIAGVAMSGSWRKALAFKVVEVSVKPTEQRDIVTGVVLLAREGALATMRHFLGSALIAWVLRRLGTMSGGTSFGGSGRALGYEARWPTRMLASRRICRSSSAVARLALRRLRRRGMARILSSLMTFGRRDLRSSLHRHRRRPWQVASAHMHRWLGRAS